MEMYVKIGGGSKTLYEGDSAGLRLGALQAGLFGQKGRDGAVDHLQDRREQLGMSSEEESQWNRKRQHPLAHRHLRNHLIDQVSGGLGHASCPASRADTAALTGEPYQFFMMALITTHAQKAMAKISRVLL